MSATKRLIELDRTKSVVPFGTGHHHQFSHTDCQDIGDPTGIAIQEGEFLYGLIRMIVPELILETGTNIGVSTSYAALALQDNGKGKLVTIEHNCYVADRAEQKLNSMGFGSIVQVIRGNVLHYLKTVPNANYDFLWLDTELNQRYNELVVLYPNLAPGGIACIHDLWGLDFTEFGGVPDTMKNLLKTGGLRSATFKTPHGVTLFQKRREKDYLADLYL